MPDGCAYLAYIGTGGHRAKDASGNSIWSIKLRVRPDHSGIELVVVAMGAKAPGPGKARGPGKPIKGL